MSTLSSNISAKRIALLAGAEQPLFHTGDLAILLGIRNANTLRVTLHRLVRHKILHRVHRGLVSILPPQTIDPALLGSACLHCYAYLTTETVLRDEGVILQSMQALTFASGVSRRFACAGHHFVSRRLHPRFLHNQEGIVRTDGVYRATLERAIADMLYFNPLYHFDRPVDWEKVRQLQEKIGYPLTPHRYVAS